MSSPAPANASVLTIDTPLGPVEFHGRDTGRPLIVMFQGLFVSPGAGALMQRAWPDFDVLRAWVPGDNAPALPAPSVGVFAAAYSHALRSRFAGRALMAYGISTGALIALALRAPGLERMCLVEPPLRTGDLWPLAAELRATAVPGWETIAWPVFGIDNERHEPRDYLHLLDALNVPTLAFVGGDPLMPPRPYETAPSYVDEASRAALRRHPGVRLIEVEDGGHDLLRRATERVAGAFVPFVKAMLGPPAGRQGL